MEEKIFSDRALRWMAFGGWCLGMCSIALMMFIGGLRLLSLASTFMNTLGVVALLGAAVVLFGGVYTGLRFTLLYNEDKSK